MKILVFAVGFLFAVSAFASVDGVYITSSSNKFTPPLIAQSTAYVLEVKSFVRKDEADQWGLIGNVTLCFSVQAKPNCYHSVANFLGLAGLPKKPEDPIIYTNYIYGLEFSEPSGGKVQVETLQSIKRRVGSDGDWNDVSPGVAHSQTTIDVGSLASIDFREAKDSMKKIEVRIVEQSP